MSVLDHFSTKLFGNAEPNVKIDVEVVVKVCAAAPLKLGPAEEPSGECEVDVCV